MDFGIHKENLEDLSISIIDSADNISEILEKISNCMDELPNYYQGDPAIKLINYYKSIENNFDAVTSNIRSYSTELIRLISIIEEENSNLVKSFDTKLDNHNMKSITRRDDNGFKY